jgi:2-methylisocitrate lyase-like PEP mutase family enzyme
VSIPVIGDGDTGYGNVVNVKRTVHGYARAGFASCMIEDQVWPKRCGHTRGKEVVERHEAVARIRAAVDARDEGANLVVLARTDARATHGLEEALWRIAAFQDAGAEIVFLEAPESEAEMAAFCEVARVPALANMVEGGKTPMLAPARLASLGFKIAAYPLTLLECAVAAMQRALNSLARGESLPPGTSFEELKTLVGFDAYYGEEARYRGP